MEALVLEGPGRVVHRRDVADPQVEAPGDAVVAVEVAGLCGSDLHPYLGREPARAGVVCGHEVVGRVTAVGPDVRGVAVGDRVVAPFTTSCGDCRPCRRGLSARCERGQLLGWGDPDPAGRALHGGQAQAVRVPLADGTLVRIPEDLDAGVALLLADALPTGWAAVERGLAGLPGAIGEDEAGRGRTSSAEAVAGRPLPGEAVVVVGLGAVGLCAVVAARAMGAAEVVAVDPVEGRRATAEAIGARAAHPDDAVEAVEAVTSAADLDGAALAVDAAGPAAAQRLAASLVRPGGVLSVIAVQTDAAFAVAPVEAYDANLSIATGRAPVRSLLDRLLPAVLAGEVAVPADRIITHPGRALAEGPGLYRRFADREPGLIKATFAPG